MSWAPHARKIEQRLQGLHLPAGVSDDDGTATACSIAAINLALFNVLTDEIPECMSTPLGQWIIGVQDTWPDDMRNSYRWRSLLPWAAGTGRRREQERLAIIREWAFGVVRAALAARVPVEMPGDERFPEAVAAARDALLAVLDDPTEERARAADRLLTGFVAAHGYDYSATWMLSLAQVLLALIAAVPQMVIPEGETRESVTVSYLTSLAAHARTALMTAGQEAELDKFDPADLLEKLIAVDQPDDVEPGTAPEPYSPPEDDDYEPAEE